jgi:hypothetical protein
MRSFFSKNNSTLYITKMGARGAVVSIIVIVVVFTIVEVE